MLLADKWEDDKDPTGWYISEKLDGVRGFWDGQHFFFFFINKFIFLFIFIILILNLKENKFGQEMEINSVLLNDLQKIGPILN